MTPSLPSSLDVLARPVTYLTWDVRSIDGHAHAVAIYDDTSATLAVNTPRQRVVGSREKMLGLEALRFGSEEQPILAKKGDNLRIDWGYVYAAAPGGGTKQAIGSAVACRQSFLEGGGVPAHEDTRMPRAASDEAPVMALVFDLGQVSAAPVSCYLILAY